MAVRAQLLLLVLASLQAAVTQAALQRSEQRSSPIQTVVTLLQEMKTQVEKEAKEDLEAYDKYMCWCQTNEKEKTAAIAAAEQTVQELTALLEEAQGKEGMLKTQIASLAQGIQEDQDALASAAGVREKESAAFRAEERDSKETRKLLQEAVQVLSKVQLVQKADPAMRQEATAALIQVRDVVAKRHPEFQSVMQRDLFDVLGSLEDLQQAQQQAYSAHFSEAFLGRRGTALEQNTQPAMSEEEAGMAAKPNSLSGAAAGAKSYNAKSGPIVGILSAMLDQFTRDLSAAQKADLEAEIQFQHLRAAKTGEVAAAVEQKKQKEAELADLLASVAQAKADLETTSQALVADRTFLANMRESCKEEDEHYQARVKDRNEEIRALGETLAILTEDSARDNFGKTMSLLQVSALSTSELRRQELATERALRHIARVARKHNDWALVSLAVHVRLDSFTKVKEAMDTMLAELSKQQKEEYEKRELCNKVIDETEDLHKEASYTKEDLAEKFQALTNMLDTLNREVDQLKKEVAEMEVALKQAGEQRKAANQLFQSSISDQRVTVQILEKAQKRLQEFYTLVEVKQHGQVGQAQPGRPVGAEPPKPQGYQKSAGAGGVLQLLAKIIKDAEVMETQLQVDEQHAQKSYAQFVQDTTTSIEQARAQTQEKQAQIANTEGELSETKGAQLANNQEIEQLEGLLKAHHLDCDFLLQYFDIRQKARAEEMDSINDAKAILSGANYGK